MKDRLKIIAVENNQISPKNNIPTKKTRRQEAKAYFDRLWLLYPEQFDPNKNNRERERINKTLDLIVTHLKLENRIVADLGCGSGVISKKLKNYGAIIDAIDISCNALKELQKGDPPFINTIQDYVPATTLQDEHYDIVLSTELIAHLPQELHRLYFSELARIVKPEGQVVSSTAIDINSEDALERFISLAETEFDITHRVFSYHRWIIKISNFFRFPARFIKAAKDPDYRYNQLINLSGFRHWWFSINSTPAACYPWYLIKYIFYPIVYLLTQNQKILFLLEQLCRFCCGDLGISHIIFIGKRKRIFHPVPQPFIPSELKHKKQVWE